MTSSVSLSEPFILAYDISKFIVQRNWKPSARIIRARSGPRPSVVIMSVPVYMFSGRADHSCGFCQSVSQ